MRKLIWCCSAAGVLAAGSFLSLAYYACRCPDSVVGRSMQVIAEASLAMQPLSGLASMARHANPANTPPQETAGSNEECIPDEPRPIAPQRKEEVNLPSRPLDEVQAGDGGKALPPASTRPLDEVQAEAAPIVIREEDPMPAEPLPPPAGIEIPAMQGVASGCPIVMPYCQDDGEPPITPPIMPHAEGDDDQPAAANEKKPGDAEDSENKDFKEWMKLFEEENKKDKAPAAEELPPPTEEGEKDKSSRAEELPPATEDVGPQAEPKCQEDRHLHEHYSGCPRVTCPYTGKSYPVCKPAKKTGTEESSEEPPQQDKNPHHGKRGTEKEECPCVPGVDTMEYRKSDGGLNEFGPGPLH
jgi:hypothetical protein